MAAKGKGSETNIDWDIRFFRRYPKETYFAFTVQGRIFTARTVDYSLPGVGIVIDDATVPLAQGDYISLDIEELDLHENGRVAWIRKTPSSLRVGILKSKPFRGRFTLYPLPDILISLQRTSKTGILNVSYGPINKKVYIRNGNVISAASNYEKDRLGDVLLKSGKINKKQYDKAGVMKRKSGSRYTAILLHMGYLKPSDVIRAAELQSRRIVGSLFARKDYEFEFIEGPLPSADAVSLNLSVADLIYRAVKMNADVELIDNYFLDSVVDFSSDPLNLFQNIRFTAADRAVLSYVDGKTSIRDIVRLSTVGRANPLKVIYALLEARFLKIKEKHEAPSGIHQEEILGRNVKNSGLTSAEIERIYSEYKDLDYYSVLGLDQSGSADAIKKAYYRAARKYHPDMYHQMPEETKKKLIEIFTRITNAYQTLSNPIKRKGYDSDIWGHGASETETFGERSGMSVVKEDIEQKEHDVEPPDSAKSDENANIASIWFRDGKMAFWNKNFRKAAQLFATAIYYDSSVSGYHYFYGYALGMLGKLKEAASALNRADELNPRNADILAEMGHVYLKLGFPLRAKGYFGKALKLNPSNDRAKEGIKMVKN
jgi:curved DNA-binding protein CbpA